jgi:proline iminopeptidase
VPAGDAQDIADALPLQWVRYECFADCGHGIWRDDPDAALAVLRRFIAA